MHQVVTGVRDVGRGLGMLRAHPALWKWVIAPAAVTLVLLIALIIGVVQLVDPLVGWLVTHLPSWLAGVASSLLTVMIVIGLSFCALVLFVALAGAIAGPFNEMLSERLEAVLTGQPEPPFSWAVFAREAALGVVHSIRRLISSLIGLVVVFVVGLVPVIGTIAAVLIGGWLAARSASYDCYDAVLARRSMAYRDKLAYLARHRRRSFGLGAAVAGMLLVPGVNLIALGVGAAGATVAIHALETGAGARAMRRS
jgi:CysZ protein